MVHGRRKRNTRPVVSFLLIALIARSLVPLGYMPAAEPFRLEICPEGLPPGLLGFLYPAQHHHHHGHSAPGAPHEHDPYRNEHCAFAAASGMGPTPHSCTSLASAGEVPTPPVANCPAHAEDRRFCIAQPRAPPVLA